MFSVSLSVLLSYLTNKCVHKFVTSEQKPERAVKKRKVYNQAAFTDYACVIDRAALRLVRARVLCQMWAPLQPHNQLTG